MSPDQLFTAESLLTLGGASLGVTLAGNTAQYIFGWNPRWFGLVVAFALAGLEVATKPDVTWVDGVVAFFQGLQIFAAAVGIASITGSARPREETRTRGFEPARAGRRYWSRWF